MSEAPSSNSRGSAPRSPVIPGFAILGEIGRGGMGAVYRVRELATDRELALKWVPASAPEVTRERFLREARIAARLEQPGIVKIHSALATPAGAYIAMELVRGASLDKILDEKRLPRERLLAILAKTARALAAAHAAGVVHRDVKPANVLVGDDGEPRLADFGLSRAEGDSVLTRPNQIMGTPLYLSPEAASGQTVGAPADVFALGAMLYEVLTGRPPFDADSVLALTAQITACAYEALPPDTPEALARLCASVLVPDPAARPSALAFAEALEAAPRSRKPVLLVGGVLAGSLVLGAVLALLAAERAEPLAPLPPAPAPPPVLAPAPVPPAPPRPIAEPLPQPFDQQAAAHRCRALLEKKDYERLDDYARRCIEAVPGTTNHSFYTYRGMALIHLRKFDQVENAIEPAVTGDKSLAGLPTLVSLCAAALAGNDALFETRLAGLEKRAHAKASSPEKQAAYESRALAAEAIAAALLKDPNAEAPAGNVAMTDVDGHGVAHPTPWADELVVFTIAEIRKRRR